MSQTEQTLEALRASQEFFQFLRNRVRDANSEEPNTIAVITDSRTTGDAFATLLSDAEAKVSARIGAIEATMSVLSTWKGRAVLERDELGARTKALREYLHGPAISALSDTQRGLMFRQLGAMDAYHAILSERIKAGSTA